MNSRSEGADTDSEARPLHKSIDGPEPANGLYLTPNSHFWQNAARQIGLWLRQISISSIDLTVILPQAMHQGLFRSAWLGLAPTASVLPQLLTLSQILTLQRLQQAGPSGSGAENLELQALALAQRWQAEGHLPKAYAAAQLGSRLALARDVLQLRERWAPLAQMAPITAGASAENHMASDHGVVAEAASSPDDGGWMLRMALQEMPAAAWWNDAAQLDAWCAAQRGALVLVLAEEPEPRLRRLMQLAQARGLPLLCLQAGFGRGFGPALARASGCFPAAHASLSRGEDSNGTQLPNHLRDQQRTASLGAASCSLPPRMARLLAQRLLCGTGSKLEEQAQATVGLVLRQRAALPQSRMALIALDRRLARRVNALLARVGLPVRDEAGWLLSTTRAAASLEAVFEVLDAQAGSDAKLDLLKQPGVAAAAGLEAKELEAIEVDVRAARLLDARAWRAWALQQESPAAGRHQRVLDWLGECMRRMRKPGKHPVAGWADALLQTLHSLGLAQAWSQDAAGAQILALLQAQAQDPSTAHAVHLQQNDYLAWLRLTLEAAVFRPEPDAAEGEPAVHVLALRDALLRPWDLCILAGADAGNLPAWPDAPGGLGDQACNQLGLPTRGERRTQAVQLAVKLVLGCRCLVVFEASPRPDHPGPSPLLELWRWAMGRFGQAPYISAMPELSMADLQTLGVEPQRVPTEAAAPQAHPAAPADIPSRWSPSAYADLRACPYRFFARRILRLAEDEDLLPDFSKRDFGNTLHRILEQFHQQQPGLDLPTNRDLLDRIAAEAWSSAGALAEPFAAVWPAVRDNYLDWLQAWRARGWEAQGEEQSLRRVIGIEADPADDATSEGDALWLEGRIDRIDRRGAERYALDYKTGDPQALKSRMKRYAEDTQLLCYALLLGADAPDAGSRQPADASPARIAAGYLVVSERRDPEHTDAATELPWAPDDLREQSAQLLAQMRRDWRALCTGQAMPALGEPPLCDHCEARGLCRRDHRPSPQSARSQSTQGERA
ncbi:hypothetical protein THIX_60189 [Thiomonas sp. X19]|uniref:PD-(D/E)XK nuclease family protein n=1 Tax=Thiomonas sp. X19 TaxID=1050370 RepID=UPI000B6B4A05|nr:PD-(D/E)XK nuclease family protein [Thiomonas sp. X19]SCC94131.1 hypothetical protein THIX_60189 [Thiomonas sp. X19]